MVSQNLHRRKDRSALEAESQTETLPLANQKTVAEGWRVARQSRNDRRPPEPISAGRRNGAPPPAGGVLPQRAGRSPCQCVLVLYVEIDLGCRPIQQNLGTVQLHIQ